MTCSLQVYAETKIKLYQCPITAISFTPDEKFYATYAPEEDLIKVSRTKDNKLLKEIKTLAKLDLLSLSYKAKYLSALRKSRSVYNNRVGAMVFNWDVKTGKLISKFKISTGLFCYALGFFENHHS
jgi:hypothetical protein